MTDYGEQILERSPNKGCLILRNEIRKYLGRNRSIYADTEQIVVGSGAEYLYNLIVGLFEKDTVFALEDPSYEKIEKVYRIAGVCLEMLPLGENGIESEALSGTAADILHISPYRSFPSGITASASKKHDNSSCINKDLCCLGNICRLRRRLQGVFFLDEHLQHVKTKLSTWLWYPYHQGCFLYLVNNQNQYIRQNFQSSKSSSYLRILFWRRDRPVSCGAPRAFF